MKRFLLVFCLWWTSLSAWAQVPMGQLDLMEGIEVKESAVGVQVVSVREDSQAYGAGVRVGDRIIRMGETAVSTVSEFEQLAWNTAEADKVTLLAYRHSEPQTFEVHRFSYPVLARWGFALKPNLELRFGEADIGSYYWIKQAITWETAEDWSQAIYAYLNALHHKPDQVHVVIRVAELYARLGDGLLTTSSKDALDNYTKSIHLLNRLFDENLDTAQLKRVRDLLKSAILATQQSSESS